jgi:hypothetical protein
MNLACAILMSLFFIASCASDHTENISFEIHDVLISDQGLRGPRKFIVGENEFTETSKFLSWIASLPKGTKLRWNSGCFYYENLPLEDSSMKMSEFKSFCSGHGIVFTWTYGY